jgi:hypothetical protein
VVKAMRTAGVVLGVWLIGSVLIGAQARVRSAPTGELFRQDVESRVFLARGEPIRDGEAVRTGSEAGLVRFDDGVALRLEPNSAAVFQRGSSRVSVHVLSGLVSVVAAGGRVLQGGSGSRFALPEADWTVDAEALLLQPAPARTRRR